MGADPCWENEVENEGLILGHLLDSVVYKAAPILSPIYLGEVRD